MCLSVKRPLPHQHSTLAESMWLIFQVGKGTGRYTTTDPTPLVESDQRILLPDNIRGVHFLAAPECQWRLEYPTDQEYTRRPDACSG